MTFHIGQRVVCVATPRASYRAKWAALGGAYAQVGEIYTIGSVNHWPHRDHAIVTVIEIDNSGLGVRLGDDYEPGFPAWAFRPIAQRKTDISIFKRIKDRVPEKVA